MNKSVDSKPVTKDELISIVGPLFEETKSDTRRLGVLMEHMNNKIDTALEVSTLVTHHDIAIKNYGERLDRVETDLNVIKVVLTRPKK